MAAKALLQNCERHRPVVALDAWVQTRKHLSARKDADANVHNRDVMLRAGGPWPPLRLGKLTYCK